MFTAWLNIKRKYRSSPYEVYDAVGGRSWPDLRRKVEAEFARGQHWKIFGVNRFTVGLHVLNIRTFRKFPLKMPEVLQASGAEKAHPKKTTATRVGGKRRC